MKYNLVITLVILMAFNSCRESQPENSTKTDWTEIEKKIHKNDQNKLFLSYWVGMDSTEFVGFPFLVQFKNIHNLSTLIMF
jgi:hypothetical protein